MTTETISSQFMDTPTLMRLNNLAIKRKKNRALADTLIDMLDPEGFHIVSWSMVHNDKEIRALLMCKVRDSMKPVEVFLDMDFVEFNKLPVHTTEKEVM